MAFQVTIKGPTAVKTLDFSMKKLQDLASLSGTAEGKKIDSNSFLGPFCTKDKY